MEMQTVWSVSTEEQFMSSFLTCARSWFYIATQNAQGLNRSLHSLKWISLPACLLDTELTNLVLRCTYDLSGLLLTMAP